MKCRASGGGTGLPPLPKTKGLPAQSVAVGRAAGIGMARKASGFIHSPSPGRADKIGMNARNGSFVLPSDTVSHIGGGNSVAGAAILDKLLGQGPYGSSPGHISAAPHIPAAPQLSYLKAPNLAPKASGGPTRIPIAISGGEYLIPPQIVARIGGGNLERGFKILDALVLRLRRANIAELKKLKPPQKN
jgi:hypothetical protein